MSLDPLELLDLLAKDESTSSGRGASYYTETCPKRIILDKEYGRETSFQAKVGTAFHLLAKLYYTGQLKDTALPLDDLADFDNDFAQEALRLFSPYIQFFPPDEWDVVAAERLLPGLVEEIGQAEYDRRRELMRKAVGLADAPAEDYFSQRSDVVVHLNEQQADEFSKRRFLAIEPGNWLVDYKTHGQKDAKAEIKYNLSLQFTSNMLAHDAVFPEDEIKGLIVVEPIRHKKLTRDSYRTFIIQKPGEIHQAMIQAHFRRKAEFLRSGVANPDSCDDWGACHHFRLGRCNNCEVSMKKVYKDRLLKLATHLEGRRLGNKRFNFGILIDGKLSKNGKCGTVGCAIGECPTVFPGSWKVVLDKYTSGKIAGGVQLRGRHTSSWLYDAATFFGIELAEARLLFMPYSLYQYDEVSVVVGVKQLGPRVKPKAVAKNIRKFVAYKEKESLNG